MLKGDPLENGNRLEVVTHNRLKDRIVVLTGGRLMAQVIIISQLITTIIATGKYSISNPVATERHLPHRDK